MSEFTKMSVKQLKDYCRNNRIKGYSTLKKSELIVLVKKVNRKSNLVKKSRKPSRKPKKTSRKPKKKSRKPKKTSRKPMKSQMSDRLNKSQKEYLKKLEKAINEVSKMSKKTSRKPKKTSRKPVKKSRKPVKTSRKPKKTSRKPVKKSRKPVKKSRKPKKTSRKPKKVRKYKVKTPSVKPLKSILKRKPTVYQKMKSLIFNEQPTTIKKKNHHVSVYEPGPDGCIKAMTRNGDFTWKDFLKHYYKPIKVMNETETGLHVECLDKKAQRQSVLDYSQYVHNVNGFFCCKKGKPEENEVKEWILDSGIKILKTDMLQMKEYVDECYEWKTSRQPGIHPDACNKILKFHNDYELMEKHAKKLKILEQFNAKLWDDKNHKDKYDRTVAMLTARW
jgi:hypothetical protein